MRPFTVLRRFGAAQLAAGMLAGVGGCGSYWDIRPDDELEYGCSGVLNWYPDCDRDGFGDRTASPIAVECEGNLDEADALSANCQASDVEAAPPLAPNQLDCDGDDPTVTANMGICPERIGEGAYRDPYSGEWVQVEAPSTCVRGLVAGDVEFVATCGSSPQLSSAQSITSCERWGGSLRDDALEENQGYVGLARLRTAPAGMEEFLADLEGQGVTALWIDLSYDPATREWTYPTGDIPIDFPACDDANPPTLGDIWTEVNAAALERDTDGDGVPDRIEREVGTDPDDRSSVSSERGVDRLALLKIRGRDGWCWGAPSRYDLPARSAYPLCQRPLPKAEKYAEAPAKDEATGG